MSTRYIIATLLATIALCGRAADLEVKGTNHPSLKFEADKGAGLEAVIVADATKGATLIFTHPGVPVEKWERYSAMGGAYAEPVPFTAAGGGRTHAPASEGDMGYIITLADGKSYAFWVVDYSLNRFELHGASVSPESDCSSTRLMIDCSGTPIRYHGISGRAFTLSSDIKVQYRQLVWDADNFVYRQDDMTTILESPKQEFSMDAVLCDTDFRVSGDRFLDAWGEAAEASTDTYRAIAVAVHGAATQIKEDKENSNEITSGDDSTLGGSAPAEIEFSAYASDAVIHDEWQMSADPEFTDYLYRFNQRDISYIFQDEGTYYMRFVGSNADGSCESYSDVFTISIGASELKCPNAFTPNSTPGVNDEWKVSYRSIVSFRCDIFNRYGVLMCSFSDPSQGWDGKYRGKYVKSGVYYYVIDARGADGKHYKLSGDINIIDYKGGTSTGGDGTDTPPETTE